MAQFTKREAVRIAINAAERYEKCLSNKTLLFLMTDKHKRVHTLEVAFEPNHFKHLTGLDPENKMSALKFYRRCLTHQLGTDDISFAKNGTTHMKLEVLPNIVSNNLSANMAGNFDGTRINLYTEKVVGNISACIGFVHRGNKYIPNTLLNVDIRQASNTPLRVISTFRKPSNNEAYSELVYKAPKVDWDRIEFPKEYSYLLTLVNQSS